MKIRSGRNGNHSIFNIITIMWYRLSLMSRTQMFLFSLKQEQRTSTGSRLFAFLNSCFFSFLIFRGIVSIRAKTLSNAHLVALRYIKREIASLPVDVRC